MSQNISIQLSQGAQLPQIPSQGSALYIALLCISDIDSRTSFTNGRIALHEASDNEAQNIELPHSTGDSNTHDYQLITPTPQDETWGKHCLG